MRHAYHDEIHQIVQSHQAAPVVHRSQRQWPPLLHCLHQHRKVGLDARPINQRRANDHHLHPRISTELPQASLGLVLAQAVSVLRVGNVGFSKWSIRLRALAIDLRRADKHKPLDPRCCRLACQVQSAAHVDGAERGDGVGRGVLHDVDAGG